MELLDRGFVNKHTYITLFEFRKIGFSLLEIILQYTLSFITNYEISNLFLLTALGSILLITFITLFYSIGKVIMQEVVSPMWLVPSSSLSNQRGSNARLV